MLREEKESKKIKHGREKERKWIQRADISGVGVQ